MCCERGVVHGGLLFCVCYVWRRQRVRDCGLLLSALSIFWVGGRLRYVYPRDLSHGGGSWVLILKALISVLIFWQPVVLPSSHARNVRFCRGGAAIGIDSVQEHEERITEHVRWGHLRGSRMEQMIKR